MKKQSSEIELQMTIKYMKRSLISLLIGEIQTTLKCVHPIFLVSTQDTVTASGKGKCVNWILIFLKYSFHRISFCVLFILYHAYIGPI